VIALALWAAVMVQDTNTALSPRVRAMIERFPLPRAGEPSIAIRFSRDTVWVGEQVELVTAAWFPRQLRDRLRRQPTIKSPSLSGLWSARNQGLPVQAATRMVGHQAYDLYITYQTIFPLGAGRVEAPPAVLSYGVPTSTSYFAPEDRKTFVSDSATLTVRGVPSGISAALGTGPTARDLRLSWRTPAAGLRVGSPAIVELAISGTGNLTLWPTAQITWPRQVHVYPEPTEEHAAPVQALIAGEKRFRFTVVADSAGVLTLPAVTYPYFDPVAVQVRLAVAAGFSLPILPRPAGPVDRTPPLIAGGTGVPVSTRIIRSAWPPLIALALLPPVLFGWRRRRRVNMAPTPVELDPERALRFALGAPLEAGPDHVVAALRLRGIPRDDAEHIHRWLNATGRRRYGPNQAPAPDPPPAVVKVLARLRHGATFLLLVGAVALHARRDDGVSRYNGGDYAGAARAFDAVTRHEPDAARAWLDLGAARWMQGDDVGATAAWLRGLNLAPRDPLLRVAWAAATTTPADIRALAPAIPVSLDESLIAALLLWLALWVAVAQRWRRAGWSIGVLLVAVSALALARSRATPAGLALVTATTEMRISPHPAMESVGEVAAWSQVQIDRRDRDWVLVTAPQPPLVGSIGSVSLQGWIPVTSVAELGPRR
jgi:hypothetical protein